ncbi:MAG: hypothetical protein ACRD3W_00005, partial [Terriglobales bacterium]
MSDRSTCKPWELRFAASVRDGNSAEFRVWAPNLTNLSVRILSENRSEPPRTIPMTRSAGSEFVATILQVSEGADYIYLLDGERERPDPVSRWQPGGVHGPSRIVDPRSFPWSDQGWSGIPLQDFIIYEFHTGTFTREGTFESVIPRLPYLRDLGITA